MAEPLLTIGEVAERAGVATSTIRHYERLDLLVAIPELQASITTASPPSGGSCS